MELTMRERRAVTKVVAPRYQKAKKKEKGKILDEFLAVTGYDRCYGSWLLRHQGKRVRLNRHLVVVGDVSQHPVRKRPRVYDEPVRQVLTQVWLIMDCLCGQRLAPILPDLISRLEEHGEIRLTPEVRQKLTRISARTIDRVLAAEKKKQALKRRSRTKPGTLLKHQIPVRTFAQWDEQRPGFVEIDLVAHEGGQANGDYAQTLDVTDVWSGWTETQAVKNKAQVWVVQAMETIRARLPFPLRGIDSDNGGEFINAHLLGFCQHHHLTFTRARPYRKNDNCYVEQKNYSVVRRAVGYRRYEGEAAVRVLNQLYASLRLYTNYFQPTMKLVSKTRVGSRVQKKYDRPQTPYQRLLQSPHVPKAQKRRMQKEFAQLNPAALKRQITRCQQQLQKLATRPVSVYEQRSGRR